MMVIVFAIAAFTATSLGGLFALKFQDRLHLILGFSAGSVLGVAFFDLLPEAIDTGHAHSGAAISAAIAAGFLLYLVLGRMVFPHSGKNVPDGMSYGHIGAATLAIHSCMDGVAIGLASQISARHGLIVAVAVIAHDFSDGINTINVAMEHGIDRRVAMRWLFLDAIAPVMGVFATLFFSVQQEKFGYVLALFCGFFLYIGAADLLPESHHAHPTRLTTLATLLGVGLLYVVIRSMSR